MWQEHLCSFVRAVATAGILIAVGEGLTAAPPADEAKPPAQDMPFPFADPQAMLDRFFGQPTEEEKKELAKIEVSAKEEREAGSTAVRAYLAHLERGGTRVVSRGRDVEYLRELVESLRPQMRQRQRYRTIKVYLAQSPTCDARSLPGGTLVFFRGLLESAENEAALVGIVGHELAHLDRGHHLWRIRRIKLAEQTFSGRMQGFSPEQFFASGAAILRIWTRPFAPELEMEADRDGALWAYRAGYDPREMGKLFLSLDERRKAPRVPMPAFLESHPAPVERHRAIIELYRELQRTEPREDLYVGKENLRRRVARDRREFPE